MIGIIGRGRMAQVHATAFSRTSRAPVISYVCTPRPGPPLEHAPMAKMVSDLEDVLSDESVRVVIIATPTPSHSEITIRALAAGKNVLLEKPVALTGAEAQAIRSAASTSAGILMVAHVVRFFAGYQRLRQARDDGSLGSVLSVRASRATAHNPAESWLRNDALSGGMLVDFAIHDFDQLNLLLGIPVTAMATRSGADGPIETTVEYASGRLGSVQTFMALPAGAPLSSSLDVIGSVGIAGYRYSSGPLELSHYYGMSAGETGHAGSRPDPFVQQAEYFLHCLAAGKAPDYSPLESAITALSVSLAARESLLSGCAVRVARI